MEELIQKGRLAKEASYPGLVAFVKHKNHALCAIADAQAGNTHIFSPRTQRTLLPRGKIICARVLIGQTECLPRTELTLWPSVLNRLPPCPAPSAMISQTKRPQRLENRKVRVPLGVIGIIYEARPNVTADAAVFVSRRVTR